MSLLPFSKLVVEKWEDAGVDVQLNDLREIIMHYSPMFTNDIDCETKTTFCTYVVESFANIKNVELQRLQLEFLKIILRNKSSSDLPCFEAIAKLLCTTACLIDFDFRTVNTQLLFEAEKCLVNLSFNSTITRKFMENVVLDSLTNRISFMRKLLRNNGSTIEDEADKKYSYLKELSTNDLKEFYFLDLRIAFVNSAQLYTVQQRWLNDTDKTQVFYDVLSQAVEQMLEKSDEVLNSTIEYNIAQESLKILFNIYCHGKIFDLDVAEKCAIKCSEIIKSNHFDFSLKQSAVNFLAVVPSIVGDLCPKVENNMENIEVYEGYNIEFAKLMLVLFETATDELAEKEVQLLGTFFTVLIHLCLNNKAARRYCRLKIIPPLTAKEVEHPPSEGHTLRNKIVRLIQTLSTINDLAAELLFVLCKRSVSRMIKYCGFGHSAGLLANYGFLGSAGKKSESDSEDSETEDYKEVEEKVNPVTGFIPSTEQLKETKRIIDSMSEEQKEYEAIKLANTLNKLIDEGMVTPATIGPDGRPKQVGHVAELVKDVKTEEKEASDSD